MQSYRGKCTGGPNTGGGEGAGQGSAPRLEALLQVRQSLRLLHRLGRHRPANVITPGCAGVQGFGQVIKSRIVGSLTIPKSGINWV